MGKLKEARKEIRKARRRDKRDNILESISKELTIIERSKGIKQLAKPYNPKPFSRKTKDGKHIPKNRRAAEAAIFLEQEIWGNNEQTINNEAQQVWDEHAYPQIHENIGINEDEIMEGEVTQVIKKG